MNRERLKKRETLKQKLQAEKRDRQELVKSDRKRTLDRK